MAIKRHTSLLEKAWDAAIEQEMTKKPWLWFFDKPSKTKEEAKKVILENNPYFGFFIQGQWHTSMRFWKCVPIQMK